MLGTTVALFSVGRFVASMFFGWMLDRNVIQPPVTSPLHPSHPHHNPAHHSHHTPKSDCRPALVVALITVIFGHLLYVMAGVWKWLVPVLISRTCTGFGTGLCVCVCVCVCVCALGLLI